MGSRILALMVLLGVAVAAIAPGFASTEEEHARLAETAFDGVLATLGGSTTVKTFTIPLGDSADLELSVNVWRDLKFSTAVARFAQDDRSWSRFHRRGQSIQSQLEALTASDLADALQELQEIPLVIGSQPEPPIDVVTGGGVVANFWRYHWLALRYAAMAAASVDERESLLRRGLVLEAVAQGYLGDAFAAGHLMPPATGWLRFAHPHNTRVLHDSYTNSGVYVIDSRHQVWQTFGEGLLFWYPQAMNRVLQASEISLQEFFVCFYANLAPATIPPGLTGWLATEFPGRNPQELTTRWLTAQAGDHYYHEMRLASLSHLPMPIAATWSVRAGEPDEHNIRARKHYPQTSDPGSHDPTLTSHEHDALYAQADLPAWMRLPRLDEKSPADIIRFDQDVAAPIFVQEWDKKPSIIGGALTGGVGQLWAGGKGSTYVAYGLGIGLSDELVHAQYLPNLTQAYLQLNLKDEIDGNAQMVSGSLVMQVRLPRIADLHFETGATKGVRGALKRAGPLLAVGLTSRTLTLPGIYVGARLRVRYEASFLEEVSHGVLVGVVLF